MGNGAISKHARPTIVVLDTLELAFPEPTSSQLT